MQGGGCFFRGVPLTVALNVMASFECDVLGPELVSGLWISKTTRLLQDDESELSAILTEWPWHHQVE